jgi:serine protease inhibitor
VESPEFLYSDIQKTKQKTTVSFDEDGTIVKTVTFSFGAAGTSTAPGGSQVDLNQPFVYCIKDRSGLPLVLGAVNDPTK